MPLSPEYQAMFEQLAANGPVPKLSELPIAVAREGYRLSRPVNPDLAIHAIENRTIDGPLGNIPIRIYRPAGDGLFGTLVYFHGGGWVIGDLDTCDSVCREIATLAGVVVVSVDYRLAPEHVFPAAVNDCYAAVLWAAEHATELAGNGKIGVAGESAGGTLATVMAQMTRDQGGPALAFQGLFYPVVEADMNRQSWSDNGAGYLLETAIMQWFWETYCATVTDRDDPRTAPIKAANLANLPPALVLTAEYDPLRDEGEAFGEALQAAGSKAQIMRCEGLVHDFLGTAAVFDCSRGPLLATVEQLKTYLN
jgi:acetyl esterase